MSTDPKPVQECVTNRDCHGVLVTDMALQAIEQLLIKGIKARSDSALEGEMLMLGFCLCLPLAHVAIYINGAHFGVDHIDACCADT